jgi:hypothetical protein
MRMVCLGESQERQNSERYDVYNEVKCGTLAGLSMC